MGLRYTGRLAPSPTGWLHLGHAATFLVAYERARTAGGDLFLRLDDLDRQRCREPYVAAAREDLAWLGLEWEAEFRQTERLDRYRAAMQRLLLGGWAYTCCCSRKDVREAVHAPHEESEDEPVYGGRCRPAQAGTERELEAGRNYRLRVPEGEVVRFTDGNLGAHGFTAGGDFGDFLVWRKDGLPSYQLACAVDDAEMGITEVVRGRNLLKSTARQILLQRALGFATPVYFHTTLLRDAHGERLAKRQGALSLRALRAACVSPPAVRAMIRVSEEAGEAMRGVAAVHHTP